MLPKLQFAPRRNEERGQADHGWLKTFHTFSFAMYQDPAHMQFGALRVINEDRVAPLTGFGTHSHREYEIFSYIVSGELEHKDSLNNTEVLSRGHVQLTSTGTGITHSEKTHGKKKPVHFLQIWSIPARRNLEPKYFTRWFADAEKKRGWLRVVERAWGDGVEEGRRDGVHGKPGERELDAEKGDGEDVDSPAPVQSALTLYATMMEPSSGPRDLVLKGSKAYVHLIQTSGFNTGPASGASIRICEVGQPALGLTLKEGDGAYVQVMHQLRGCPGEDGDVVLRVENVGDVGVELVVFDLD